jgi:cellulose synthase/poly-beta-1,6-N-acetylglucosamine synthase-like glycosyltransferase
MSDNKKINLKKLPWFYRLVLKIPGTDFLESAGGIFWDILMPIFLVLEFFLSFFLLMFFPFPINLALILIIPIVTFLVFVKITLERFINWWNAVFGKSGYEWNIDKTLQEYVNLLKKQRKEGK